MIRLIYHKVLHLTEGGNSNLYIYSRNKTLMDLPLEALRLDSSLKYRFLQVDSQHRCVPSDWYMIGYDNFAIHSFLNLAIAGGSKEVQGFLKPFFERPTMLSFMIDYSKEFNVPRGILAYLKFKVSIFFQTLGELLGLLAIIKTVSSLLQSSIMDIYK